MMVPSRLRMPSMRRAALALLPLMVPALPAAAQVDAYEGRWRFVAAERAPWAAPASEPLAAPLLRSGLVIREGRMLAKAPLACPGAGLETVSVAPDAILGGGPGAARAAERHALEGGEGRTLRIACGERRTDLHLTAAGDLVGAIDGVVYTLRRLDGERDEGEDAAFVETLQASFDCARAGATVERVICAWPRALAADGAMGREFRRLRASLSPESAAELLRAQRLFNQHLIKVCRVDGPMPTERTGLRDAGACVAEMTEGRVAFLGALKVARAGPVLIEPRIATQSRFSRDEGGPRWIADDAVPVMTGPGKGVAAFAAAVRRELRSDRPLIGRRDDLLGAVTRTYTVHTLTERFVSLSVTETVDAGTRVDPVTVAINLDLASGRAVGPAEVFERGPAWREAVMDAIRPQLNEPETLDAAMLDRAVWTFAPEGASLTWPFSGGPPEAADVPAAILAPFVKAASPWRAGR